MYLTVRGDRIASDCGLLSMRMVGQTILANVDGKEYELTIVVRAVP
jgi:hypothetical protein